jgi:hypothetical protein
VEKWPGSNAYERKVRAEREEEEIKEKCTFQPRLSLKSLELAAKDHRRKAGTAIWERAEQWAMEKERRMQAERERKALEEMQECSFAPVLKNTMSVKVRVQQQTDAPTAAPPPRACVLYIVPVPRGLSPQGSFLSFCAASGAQEQAREHIEKQRSLQRGS